MRQKHSLETKAAVIAALLAGQSVSEVAAQYRVSEGTVKSWKNRQGDTPVATVATEKNREEIGGLLVGYLKENLRALQVQTRVFSSEEWLRKQDASSAAVLHGVLTDKAVRLLEALEAGADRAGPGSAASSGSGTNVTGPSDAGSGELPG